MIVLAVHDFAEAAHGVGDWHVLAGEPGELLGDEERLRQEALDAARASDRELVVFRQFVDAENRDDVLQVLVALQDLQQVGRGLVVLVRDDARLHRARRR